jgi:hypothetical protein
MTGSTLRAEQAMIISQDAYIFGYPLLLMDITRRIQTATPRVTHSRAPMNQFLHLRKFSEPVFTTVVSPNADLLYSGAWLDVSRQPMILSVRQPRSHYYLMQMLDMWTNVFAAIGDSHKL